jgi:polysaccharide pyruvyl transferase WcaK-like protein
MPVIFVGGYYGGNNLGDDAILEAMLHTLRRLRNDLQFTVASFNPDVTRAKFGVECVHWRHINELASCVRQADLVLVGGGGLFQDYWGIEPNTYLRSVHGGITTYGTLPKLAELFGVPCMLYAVGLGPLFSEEARFQTKDIFSLCAASTVRDENSRRLLHEIGWEGDAEITADPGMEIIWSTDRSVFAVLGT